MKIELLALDLAINNLWTWIYLMGSAISAMASAIGVLFWLLMKCLNARIKPWDGQSERRIRL